MNREWTRAHFSSAWWEPSGAGLLYEQNRWPVHLTKFGFTPPSLVCPVYTSKPPCVNLPHRVQQSIQNNMCCWEKNINHCYLAFFKKCAFWCAFWYVPSCFNLWNTCNCAALFAEVWSLWGFTHMLWASPSPCGWCASFKPGGPLHLRKGDKYLQWPTLSTGLKKGHRGPKKESGKATQLLTQCKRRPWLLFKAVLSECFNLILN